MKIRLTESKLKQIVAESVKKVLKENGGYIDTYDKDTLDVQEEVKDLFSRILHAIGANVNKELLNQKMVNLQFHYPHMDLIFQLNGNYILVILMVVHLCV